MDEIDKVCTLLSSIKANVPNDVKIDQRWVADFHTALDQAEEAMGLSLKEYRIPDAEWHREVRSKNTITGAVTYGGTVIDRARFLMKVDATLGYLSLQRDKKTKGQMGFSKTGK
jgi:hypothetical protein